MKHEPSQYPGRTGSMDRPAPLARRLWLLTVFWLAVVPVAQGPIYECRDRSGSMVLTSSPSQLERCRLISTAPAPSKTPGYPDSLPPIPPPPQAPGLPTDSSSVPVPMTITAPESSSISSPDPGSLPVLSSPATPEAPQGPSMAINPLHPFLPPVPVMPAGNEQKP